MAKKETLLDVARSYGKIVKQKEPFTSEEKELTLAFLKGQITGRQMAHALQNAGLSKSTFPVGRAVSVIKQMLSEGDIKIS